MDKQDYLLQPELLDEVPRFWLSRRWRMAVLGCFGFLIVTSNRIGIEVALLCMLNRTSSTVFTTHPLTARFSDQIGIVNPALRFYNFYGKSATSLESEITANATNRSVGDDLPHGVSLNPLTQYFSTSRRKVRAVLTPKDFFRNSSSKINLNQMVRKQDINNMISSPIPTTKLLKSQWTTRSSFHRPTTDKPSNLKSSPPTASQQNSRSYATLSTTTKTTTTPKRLATSTVKYFATTTNIVLKLPTSSDKRAQTAQLQTTNIHYNLINTFKVFDRQEISNDNFDMIKANTSTSAVVRGASIGQGNSKKKCDFWNATTHPFLDMDLLSLPQTGDTDWSREEHTAVWEAYYLGDLIARLPSAFLVQRFGGKHPFALAVFIQSLCTTLVPLASKLHYFPVLLLRFITGICSGVSTPALYYMLGRWAPPDERCLLLAIVNTGGWISGCAIVLPLSCLLCTYGFAGGWSSVFYVYGGLGTLWCILWMLFCTDDPELDNSINQEEKDYICTSIKMTENMVPKFEDYKLNQPSWIPPCTAGSTPSVPSPKKHLRWPVVLTSMHLLTLASSEFTQEWIIMTYYCVLTIYTNHVLNYAIDEYSVAFIIPCAGFWFAMMMSAGAADRLQSYGVLPVTHIRKIMNSVGCVVSSCMLLSVMLIGCNHRAGLLYINVIGLSFAGLQCSGVLMSPLDLASKYSAVLIGISGIARASVRFVIPPFAALLLRHNQDTGHVEDFTSHVSLYKKNADETDNEKNMWYIYFVITACSHIAAALLYLLAGTGNHQATWLESDKELASQPADQPTSDSGPEMDTEKAEFSSAYNEDNGYNSPVTLAHLSAKAVAHTGRAVVTVNNCSTAVPDHVDHARSANVTNRIITGKKEDQISDNSFVSTNTSFDEKIEKQKRGDSAAKLNPNRSQPDCTLGPVDQCRNESSLTNYSLCSTPASVVNLRLKSLYDYSTHSNSAKRASFAIESSSENRNFDDDYDDDDDYDPLASHDDDDSSVRRLSRHLRNSLVVDSDLSESVV